MQPMFPSPQPAQPAMAQPNLEHLRLLAIFHYVMGGVTALMALMPIMHVAMGIAIVSGAFGTASSGGGPPPDVMGWFFIGIGGSIILLGQTVAVCTLLAGRYLQTRQAWLFCIVVAAINCLNVPFGTTLGVLTILVLVKPEVKGLFA